MNIQIDRVRLIFLRNLPYWLFMSLRLILGTLVFIIWLGNTWLPSLCPRCAAQNYIVYIFNWVSFVEILALACIRFEHFSIIFVSPFIRLFTIGISINVGPLIRRSRWFWHVSKLLVVVWLIVALAVTSAFWLVPRIVRLHCFVHLLVPRRHPFFQKLQTTTRFFNILTAIVRCDHAVSLRSRVSIIALSAESSLVSLLIVVTLVHVLLVHASMILIWIAAAVVTPTDAVVLNRMQTRLSIAILLPHAQAGTDLIVSRFSLAVMRSLLSYLIIRVVVVLSFRDLAVSDSRITCRPKELINYWKMITLARICVPMAVSADKLVVVIGPDWERNWLAVDKLLHPSPGKRRNIGRDIRASFAAAIELPVKSGTCLESQGRYFRCHHVENAGCAVEIFRCLS